MAVVLAVGRKGCGKSTALRRLAYQVLKRNPASTIFWADHGAQLAPAAGRLFTSASAARSFFAAHGVPRLCIFRGVEVEELAQLALQVRDVTLVLDELDRACSGKSWRSPSVRRIVHEGRHERVDLWGSFRSTRNVHEDLVGAADAALLFRTSDAAYYDLQILKLRFGPGVAAELPALEPGEFLLWTDAA